MRIENPVAQGNRRFEQAADQALLSPELALAQLARSVETSELRTRACSARRTIVTLAGAEHKILTVGLVQRGWPEHFDMVDFTAVLAGDAFRRKRLTNAPRIVRQRLQIAKRQLERTIMGQKEPVPAPGDISAYGSETVHLDTDVRREAVARHIRDRDSSRFMKLRLNDPHRSLDAMKPRRDLAHIRESCCQADRPVPAHSEIPDVIEENHARHTRGIGGFRKQSPYNRIRASRLIHDGGTEVIVLFSKDLNPFFE